MKEERVEGGDLPEAGPLAGAGGDGVLSLHTGSKRKTTAVSAQQSSFIGTVVAKVANGLQLQCAGEAQDQALHF